jgi:superfamily II DNA/RNA helicase
VHEYFSFLCKGAPPDIVNAFSSELLIGGLSLKDQRKKLLVKKPNVIIGTLGRIKEVIDKEYIDINDLKILLLDESDKFTKLAKCNKSNSYKFMQDLSSLL